MGQTGQPRRSLGGAIFLIALGVLFLFFNLRPEFNPWPIVEQYWPLILIFIGLGKMWDYAWVRNHPDAADRPRLSGGSLALLALVIIFCVAFAVGKKKTNFDQQVTQAIERQGAQSVRAELNMPAGSLQLTGGSSRLLDADFRFDESEGTPSVEYNVNGGIGQLNIRQRGKSSVHFGTTHNDWELRLSNEIPMDLDLNMGAGEGELRLGGMDLSRLQVQMGAGQLRLDLCGDRKRNLEVEIHGGVGQATIKLPKNVGVRVSAHGGIGSIDTSGLHREGGDYVNDAYGKSPVAIRMTVEGGIGQIELTQEL